MASAKKVYTVAKIKDALDLDNNFNGNLTVTVIHKGRDYLIVGDNTGSVKLQARSAHFSEYLTFRRSQRSRKVGHGKNVTSAASQVTQIVLIPNLIQIRAKVSP